MRRDFPRDNAVDCSMRPFHRTSPASSSLASRLRALQHVGRTVGKTVKTVRIFERSREEHSWVGNDELYSRYCLPGDWRKLDPLTSTAETNSRFYIELFPLRKTRELVTDLSKVRFQDQLFIPWIVGGLWLSPSSFLIPLSRALSPREITVHCGRRFIMQLVTAKVCCINRKVALAKPMADDSVTRSAWNIRGPLEYGYKSSFYSGTKLLIGSFSRQNGIFERVKSPGKSNSTHGMRLVRVYLKWS